MSFLRTSTVAATALVLSIGAAHAATISVTEYNEAEFIDIQNKLVDRKVETFENIGGSPTVEGEVTPGTFLDTAVGTFTGFYGPGTGASVIGTGTNVALKFDDGGTDLYGRSNTTPGGDFFLDSNDMGGIWWNVSGHGSFNTLAFTLSDAVDVGATMRIIANGSTLETIVGKSLGDGDIRSVVVDFGSKVSSASIMLLNFTSPTSTKVRLNDGFGIDDATIGNVVPLPAAAWFLLGGLGALAAMKRRQKS